MSEHDTPIFAAARQANELLHGEARPLSRPSHPRIITIANQKGGVGKTTSTVNLAASLALGGLGVLVIDMDPQGNASTALGVDHREGTPSSYELLMWESAIEDLMQRSPHAERLFCIPATIDLAGSEIELVGLEHRERRLAEVLNIDDLVSLGIDYVFLDCPPSLGLLTVNAMVAASEVLIPIQCEYYALEGVGQLLRNVELIQQHLNRELQISTIMLTMYDGRTKLAEQVAGEVRNHFGDAVLRTVIPRSVKVSEAPGYGMTILQYDAGSRGALAYLDAARELNDRSDRLVSHSDGTLDSAGTEGSR
ncbi:chromosome partitioning protein [Dietzia sp. UCD-THP]|uniref:ParA family protein n=1 Tax=Dietzia sp. UCD-THP TaxID=1292020 RepID=UPI00035E6141|nr:ParA family protein [Dietzia sp. UCD-THP]EYT65627.1 chromosome partitioning protein [Dietzia sp. UCD-THP]